MPLTAEQQKIRATGIGGSEIAALAGLSPYMRPIDVYRRKLGLAEDVEPTFHIERGTYLETGLITWYAARYGRKCIDHPGTLRHPKFPVVIATPDAIADKQVVVEIKSPSWRTASDWGNPETDAIPDYYRPQVLWEMAVTGLRVADVVAFLDGDIRRYVVPFHEPLFQALVEIAARFWRDHVKKQVPPPEDGSESYSDYLRERFPDSFDDIEETNDDEVVALVHAYRQACTALEQQEQLKREFRQKLEARIGNRKGIAGNWGKIHFKHNKDTLAVNYRSIVKALNPPDTLIAQHTTTRRGPRVFRPYLKE